MQCWRPSSACLWALGVPEEETIMEPVSTVADCKAHWTASDSGQMVRAGRPICTVIWGSLFGLPHFARMNLTIIA